MSSGAYAGGGDEPATRAAANATRPLLGPAQPWVLQAPIPAAPAAGAGASTIDLLTDVQTRLSKDGDTTYFEKVIKIASPKGLEDGPLDLSWDPALETLTLHRYRIIRDGRTLDLLGDGTKLSVIQREKNLENAMLDGELTATLQPEDLRVGDTIDLAYTRTHHDPAMGGRSEAIIGPRDGTPYGRFRARVVWPADKKVQWRAFPGIIQPKLTASSSGNELLADVENFVPQRGPNGAPSRFGLVNALEFTEFPDWAAVSRSFLPLFDSASRIAPASAVRDQASRIAKLTTDPKRRAELALALVQDQVRYLFVSMDDGGFVPASADVTWSRRFGDCKAKTVLLVALLRELGIEARPVLVNTEYGDLVATRLPAMSAFDHAIVEARIAGRSYWLDGTRRGDTRLNLLEVPSYKVALPIAAGVKGLVPLTPAQYALPSETITLALDASAGIDVPAPAKAEVRFRGQTATQMRVKYADLSSVERDEELRKFWRERYDFLSPTAMTTAVDESTGDYLLAMTGTAKMDWYADAGSRWYELDRARLGWKLDIARDSTLSRDAPFAIDYPDFWESRETIKLPRGGTGFRLQGGPVDKVVSGIYEFHRKVGIEGDVLSMEASTRALADELPAAKAEQARADMAALANSGVFVRVPDDYMATDADISALKDNKAAAADALMHRGAVEFDNGMIDASLKDENAALALDSTIAAAHAIRAIALATKDDKEADAAADRAIALDGKQWLAWRAKGMTALLKERWADADSAFSTELKLNDNDYRALVGRGTARMVQRRYADSIADFDAALAISPDLNVRYLRAAALSGSGRAEDALVDLDRVLKDKPDDNKSRDMRIEILTLLGRHADAITDLDALIAKQPKAEYYVTRAELWTSADGARRAADIAAALRLDPRSVRALGMRSYDAIEAGNYLAAETDILAIEKLDPANHLPFSLREQSLQKQRRPRDAVRIADSMVARFPKDATALNERCWLRATLNLEMAAALADCEAALKLEPNRADILDSRAFTKLRLGEIDQAISDYDAALKLAPHLPASLFGRAVARALKGDQAGARLDLAQARQLAPDVVARFAEYGVKLPDILAAK